MGILFKIMRSIVVPLLVYSFARSFLQDFMRRSTYQGGTRSDRQGSGNGNRNGNGNGYPSGDDYMGGPTSAYKVFGLSPSATDEEIRTRYHELVVKYHPDKFAGLSDPEFTNLAAKKFQKVQWAYKEIRRQRGI